MEFDDKGMLTNERIENVTLNTPLKNVVFHKCRFHKVCFTGDFHGVDFRHCSFLHVTFSKMYNIVFETCMLKHLELPKSLDSIEFHNCTIEDNNFSFLTLQNSLFSKCTLTKIDFSNLKAKNVLMDQSKCFEVNFSHGEFKHCTLKNIQCIDSSWMKSKWSRSNWIQFQLRKNTLDMCVFSGHSMKQVLFSHCSLKHSSFNNGSCTLVHWRNSNLTISRFTNMKHIKCCFFMTNCDDTWFQSCGWECGNWMKVSFKRGRIEDTKFLHHREKEVTFRDTEFKNVQKSQPTQEKAQCYFILQDKQTNQTVASTYQIEISCFLGNKKIQTVNVSDKGSFFIHSPIDYFKVDAQPSSLVGRIFPYSHQPDIHDVLTHIKINHQCYFLERKNSEYRLSSSRKRSHSV